MTTEDVVCSLRFSLIKTLPEPGFDLRSTVGESSVLTLDYTCYTECGNCAVGVGRMASYILHQLVHYLPVLKYALFFNCILVFMFLF